MKLKLTYLYLIVLLTYYSNLFGQSKDLSIFSRIRKSQIACLNHKINKDIKERYSTILNLAKQVRFIVVPEIKKRDSIFFKDERNELDLVEGYEFAHGNIYGIIWKNNTNYSYYYNVTKDKTTVEKKELKELLIEQKTILLNFIDWGNDIFKHQECGMGNSEGLYYFATKVIYLPKQVIKTTAFCY